MTKLIAEIGWSHLGNMELAKKMILAASENGADFAKFQTFSTSRLKPGPWDNDGRREIYEKAELSLDQHLELKAYCDDHEITFFSSVFSIEDARLLAQVETDIVKIASFESRNMALLRYVYATFDKIIISTGTSIISEIRNILPRDKNFKKVTLLHCVSAYPGKPEFSNLPRIKDLKELIYSVGYSDHIEGIESAKVALGYDLTYIEKHFTTNHSLPGRDNAFAILPHELAELRRFIDLQEVMNTYLGQGYQPCEQEARDIMTGRFSG